jgi:serine/threonine protein kinase/tetratricopeptide (TPR) repeat protein
MTQNSETPAVIGKRYQLHEQLGKGGLGAVYRATDRLNGQVVALKRVTVSTENLEFASESFEGDSLGLRLALAQEFRTLASLRHPHIISVLDYGFDDDQRPFFTMRLLEGSKTLSEASSKQDFDTRIDLLLQTLQALAYLHRRGIIHRDLKPANVMVDESNQAKVLDFGVSVARETGSTDDNQEIAGTLAYIAPEVLQGKRAREASDLYAIGIIAYELLTGKHPYDTGNIGQLINNILTGNPDLTIFSSLNIESATLPTVDNRVDSATEVMPESMIDDLAERTFVGKQAGEFSVPDELLPSEDETDDTDNTSVFSDLDEVKDSYPIEDAYKTVAPSSVNFEVQKDLQFRSSDLDSLDLPPLAMIIDTLLAKDPDIRYQDAYDVINDLCAAIGRSIPEESSAIRESFLQAATFVGRQSEVSQLEAALETMAIDHIGSAWLIGGESGMGKTRLIDELRTLALVQGVMVLRGQAVAGGGLPYQVWRDPLRRLALADNFDDVEAGILKDLIPDIDLLLGRKIPEPAEVEVSAYQQRLIGTIVSVFQRQTQPVLLLLEDLQWLNESLEVLNIINGMVGDLPILIVASYRTEDRPDLPGQLPDMELLKLDRLSPQDIAALSMSMLGDAGSKAHILELLQHETEGNVYFLVEVVRALAESAGRLDQVAYMDLPENIVAGGVQSVILRRLEHVPESERELLQLAAIAGRELDLNVMRRVSEGTDLEEWLTICSNSAVLEVQEGNWRFSHDKLRSAALENIADDSRPLLHRRIAEAIEVVYGDMPEHAYTLSQHWNQAGDIQKERLYSQRAGEYFLHISAFNEAIVCFERTLELFDVEGARDEIKADLFVKIGEALYHIADYDSATTKLQQGLTIFRKSKNQLGMAYALVLLGNVKTAQSEYVEARDNYNSSLSLYQEQEDQQGTGRAMNRLATLFFEQGDYENATPYFEQSLTVARETDDQRGIDNAITGLGIVAFAQGDYENATRYFEQTLEISRKTGERYREGVALMNLGAAAGSQEDFENSTRYFEQSLKIFRTIGSRLRIALALDNLGVLAEEQQDYENAVMYYEESLTLARAIGNRQGVALTLCNLGNVTKTQGNFDRAIEYYHTGLEIAHEIEATPVIMDILVGLADATDNFSQAVTWLGFVLNQSAAYEATRQTAEHILDSLRSKLDSEDFEDAFSLGKTLDVDVVISNILAVSN